MYGYHEKELILMLIFGNLILKASPKPNYNLLLNSFLNDF